MHTPIKAYYESKKRALLYGLVVFVPLMFIVVDEVFFATRGSSYVFTFINLIVLFALIFGLFIYFLPVGTLEIYQDRFAYKKGRFTFSAYWSEVNEIAFQVARGGHSRMAIPTAFVIGTNMGATKLIDTKILKQKGTDATVDLVTFVQDLESVSGKVIKWGEISTKKYSPTSFVDYLKGERLIKK